MNTDLIIEQGDGWEREWGELLVLLREKLEESTRYISGIYWPDEETRDDFISDLILNHYMRRANAGTLLMGYTTDDGDIFDYLASKSFLYKRACSYLSKEGQKSASPLPEGLPSDSNDGRSGVGTNGRAGSYLSAIHKVVADLGREMDPGKKIVRIVEQAGLQLHPRLDWARKNLAKLFNHLVKIIVEGATPDEKFAAVSGKHAEARSMLENEINGKAEYIHNSGKGRSPAVTVRLRRQIEKLSAELVFYPLRGGVIADILGIKRNDADQRRCRYRRALPALFPALRDMHERLLDREAYLEDDNMGEVE